MQLNFGSQNQSNSGNSISLNRNSNNSSSQETEAEFQPVSLVKGQVAKLSKQLNKLYVGMSWDVNEFVGEKFDLDVQVFMTDENDKVINPKFFIFYGELISPCKSVVHSGDNRDGAGEGDDEFINIDLTKIDARVKKLIFCCTIDKAEEREQNFGQVKNALIHIVNPETNKELISYNLSNKFSIETSLVVGEYDIQEGTFKAIGAGYKTDLGAFCTRFGVPFSYD